MGDEQRLKEVRALIDTKEKWHQGYGARKKGQYSLIDAVKEVCGFEGSVSRLRKGYTASYRFTNCICLLFGAICKEHLNRPGDYAEQLWGHYIDSKALFAMVSHVAYFGDNHKTTHSKLMQIVDVAISDAKWDDFSRRREEQKREREKQAFRTGRKSDGP